MSVKMTILALLVIFQIPKIVHAQDKVGQKAAQSCTACHGEHGISLNSLWPNLAGQKKDYLMKQLHDFRGGNRKNSLMSPMSQILSDKDVEEIAIYFSSLESSLSNK
jgi:cytochrome c553